MKVRVLPPDEWTRIRPEQMPPSFPYADPASISVVAVEDDAGAIVACLTVLKVLHFEGAFIDPAYRGNPGVIRALLGQASEVAEGFGEPWAMFGSADGDMRMPGFIERLNGQPMPASFSAVPVPLRLKRKEGRASCLKQ